MTTAGDARRVADDPLPQVLAKSRQAGRPSESLAYHSDAALRAASEVRDRVGSLELAEAELGGEFWRAAQLAALAHDAGKLADGFQRMLGGGGGWGQRHEVVSLGFLLGLVPDPALRLWVASAVVTHHRPLTDGDRGRSIQRAYAELDLDSLRARLGPVDEDRAKAFAEWLTQRAAECGLRPGGPDGDRGVVRSAYDLLQEVFAEWRSWVEDRDRGLAAVLLQGAVTLADHLSSGHGTLHAVQPVGDGFSERLSGDLGGVLHPHQQAAERVGGHLLLRAPTGSGKTEAGLMWAAARVAGIATDAGGVPRLFYMLPYLASINAMADRLAGMLPGGLTQVGVSHSRAASYYLATAIGDEAAAGDDPRGAAARKAVARDRATRLFRETVRVGTPYQLLRGALAGKAHAGVLVDSANSVFLLDELHAYDARRLGYILAMVRLWKRLGGRVGVLSATLPDALAELLREALGGAEVTAITAGREVALARHRVCVRDRHLTDPATVDEVWSRLDAGRSVLVVANSVRHAQELYAALGAAVRERYGPEAATLLHSRFRRGDRGELERRLGDRYGVHAARRPGLVVSTQVVEVSLDVDFDVLFTAAAPLEAMLQRFGRVNRLGGRPPADVIVHAPVYVKRGSEPGEFADGVYERAPVETAWEILRSHDGEVVDEPEAVGWLNQVYGTGWGVRWRQEVGRSLREFDEHFLAFPYPYDSRENLEERFDQLFDGTEAILAEDRDEYEAALTRPKREDGRADRRAGRLLGEEYLIPLPFWAAKLSQWDRGLKVALINGEYDSEHGLTAVRGPEKAADAYRPGEIV